MNWYLVGDLLTKLGKALDSLEIRVNPTTTSPGGVGILDVKRRGNTICLQAIILDEYVLLSKDERIGACAALQELIDKDSAIQPAPPIKLVVSGVMGYPYVETKYRGDDGCIYTESQVTNMVIAKRAYLED